MSKIFLMRHGETYAKTNENVLGEPFVCGSGSEISRNTHLTEKGIKDLEKVGESLKVKEIDLIIISDLIRSRESAEAIIKGIGKKIEINVNNKFTEINYGIHDGVSESIVKKEKERFFKENPDKNGDFSFAFPLAESFLEARKRMEEAISEIKNNYSNKNILIISHSGSMRALMGNIEIGRDLKFGEVIDITIMF